MSWMFFVIIVLCLGIICGILVEAYSVSGLEGGVDKYWMHLSRTSPRPAACGRKKWNRFKSKYLKPQDAYLGSVGDWCRAIILLGLCYIILYPFFIKIINAFKTYSDFIDPTVRFLPKTFTLGTMSGT